MDINSLNKKWGVVQSLKKSKGYRALRISSDCKCKLFIATDVDGFRCLLLFLKKGINVKLKGTNKDKLTLSYLSKENVVMVKLKDAEFKDLFNDLIISLYAKVKLIEDSEVASKELIHSFYKWSEFFNENSDHRLSIEQVQGLFGELFFLQALLTDTADNEADSILEAWKGPYNTSNDFIFDSFNVEVKAKMESKLHVRISSEFQLEKEFDKGLQLLVVSVKIDLMNGKSLYDLIDSIVKITRKKIGDVAIFYRALRQLGINLENSKSYNNHRYSVSKMTFFDTSLPEFPGLSKSIVPKEITKLSYNLNVKTLTRFITEEKIY
jgi:hypothetical protein